MTAWHKQEITEVLKELNTDVIKGLSDVEAARRLVEAGPNELQAAHRVSPWALLLEQFKNILILWNPPEADLMRRPPRNPRTGIFTRPVITLMAVGGLWSAMVNLSLFAWALNSSRSIEQAMTMTFVSLVLIQFFKAYNFRSDRHSVLHRPFANKWLNSAVLWELLLLALIIYVPFLHGPFGTFSLPLVDWLIIIGLAFTVSPVLELVKWMERGGWLGKMG